MVMTQEITTNCTNSFDSVCQMLATDAQQHCDMFQFEFPFDSKVQGSLRGRRHAHPHRFPKAIWPCGTVSSRTPRGRKCRYYCHLRFSAPYFLNSPAAIPGCKIVKNKFRISNETIAQYVKVWHSVQKVLNVACCPPVKTVSLSTKQTGFPKGSLA